MRRLLLLAIAAIGCHRRPTRAAADAGPAPIDADLGGPPAFASFAEVARAGDAARGQIAQLAIRRVVVRPADVVAVPCTARYGDLIFFTFTPAQRDRVRGLPFDDAGCATLILRVSSVGAPGFHADGDALKDDAGTLVVGDALEFPGVVARPAPAPPPGSAYGDLDEIGFAGADADGKIATLTARIAQDFGELFLRPCDRPGTVHLRRAAGGTPTGPSTGCVSVRVRIRYSSFRTDARALDFSFDELP